MVFQKHFVRSVSLHCDLLLALVVQPVLPIEVEFWSEVADKTDDEDETDEPDLEAFIDKMKDMKKGAYEQVHDNIEKAQKQQKKYYDRKKHAKSVVSSRIFN